MGSPIAIPASAGHMAGATVVVVVVEFSTTVVVDAGLATVVVGETAVVVVGVSAIDIAGVSAMSALKRASRSRWAAAVCSPVPHSW